MNSEQNAGLLPRIELDPPAKGAVASLIWLHGLGASGDDFVPVAAELQQLTGLALRFVFPQAPARPVTVNNGYIMPAWYDIYSFERDSAVDHQGLAFSVEQINSLIKKEQEKGFSRQQIIIAGFSQGAVVSFKLLLSSSEKLGGIIALSGYLPSENLPHSLHQTPIFIGHGQADEIVPCIYGQAAADFLKKAGYPVTWHSYPMAHSVCAKEIRDLALWLKELKFT